MASLENRKRLSRIKDFFQRDLLRSNPGMTSVRFKDLQRLFAVVCFKQSVAGIIQINLQCIHNIFFIITGDPFDGKIGGCGQSPGTDGGSGRLYKLSWVKRPAPDAASEVLRYHTP